MKLVESVPTLRAERPDLSEPLGFVPTMGYLHEGHLSLVRRSRTECASCVVSIFVNPTQFGSGEDLETYPRDLDRDLGLLEGEGVDLVFVPTEEEIYPKGFRTYVHSEELTQPLEGQSRPGHFRGVTTVVAKLFNLVQPQTAYFGQKDAQQALVVRRMVLDLNIPVEVVVCPTVRESDGLAMSSRNTYLAPDERKAASALSRGLFAAQEVCERGETDAERLREKVRGILAAEPAIQIEYVSCADLETLKELQRVEEGALLSLAATIGRSRLIDNVLLGVDSL